MDVFIPESNRIVHHTYSDFVGRLVPRPVHLVQYDNSLPIIAVALFKDGVPYEIPEDAEVNIRWRKGDDNVIYNHALGWDETRTIAYFEITQQMSVIEGNVDPIVEIFIDGTQCTGSGSFKVIIDKNPVLAKDLESSSEYKAIYEYVEMAETAAYHSQESALSAGYSEENAQSYATAAKVSENNAKSSADSALISATNSKTSETNAKDSETKAKTSETKAGNYAGESEAWAVGIIKGEAVAEDAAQHENNSKYWSDKASAYKTEAGTSASNAKTSETKAGTSETNAKTSETNAKTSETNAKASETKAGTSEANAKASETKAGTSETNAKASETNAKTSETNAKASETKAKTSETNSGNSAKESEAWAVGTKGGDPVEPTDPQYNNSAKHWANVASSVVNIGVATTTKTGIVKPDGTTITVDPDGTIHGASGTDTMLKSVYDKDNDGVVDKAKKVGDANTNVLEKFSEVEGKLQYNNQPIETKLEFETNNINFDTWE